MTTHRVGSGISHEIHTLFGFVFSSFVVQNSPRDVLRLFFGLPNGTVTSLYPLCGQSHVSVATDVDAVRSSEKAIAFAKRGRRRVFLANTWRFANLSYCSCIPHNIVSHGFNLPKEPGWQDVFLSDAGQTNHRTLNACACPNRV